MMLSQPLIFVFKLLMQRLAFCVSLLVLYSYFSWFLTTEITSITSNASNRISNNQLLVIITINN